MRPVSGREATETLPEGARAAILLALGADTGADPLLRNEQAFAALKPCAAAMATAGLLVMVQGTEPWSAGVGAIAKTAALEWPAASVRSIEVEVGDRSPKALAALLVEELMAGGAQIEVALMADGRRVAPRLCVEQAPVSVPVAPPGDGVLLVSGGARGVTAACLAELLAERPQRVAILGRTAQGEEPAELRGLNDDADLKRTLLRPATSRTARRRTRNRSAPRCRRSWPRANSAPISIASPRSAPRSAIMPSTSATRLP